MNPRSGRLLFALLVLPTACSSTQVVFVPASGPYVSGYVSGRSDSDPAGLEARVLDAARRRGGAHVEVVDRGVAVWQRRVRQVAYYSGVVRIRTASEDLGEVLRGYHRKVAVLYRSEDRPSAASNPWTKRQAELRAACPDLRSTDTCVGVRGTVLSNVAVRDGDRPATCAAGVVSDCMSLAWSAKHEGDHARFLALMKKACDGLSGSDACAALASGRSTLPEAVRDEYRARAERLEAMACAAGRVRGCPDEAAHRRRRCEQGQLEFCRDLARSGLPGSTGTLRAQLIDELSRYCDWGMSLACFDLSGVVEAPRALELAARACVGGVRAGCERLDE